MDYFFVSITGFALGVFARSLFPFGAPALGFMFLAAGIALLLFYFRRERMLAVIAILFVCGACGAGRAMLAPQALSAPLIPLLGTEVSLAGTIAADPDIRETNQRVMVSIEKEGEHTNVLAVLPLYPELSYGEHVQVSGEIEAPQPFETDGGRTFRYDRYLQKDGVFAIMPRAGVEILAAPSGMRARIFGALYGAKHALSRGLEAALPEPHAALAEGLLTGGKQGLGKALLDAFTVAGLVQIVVLSGYNVMIVADAAMKSLSFLPRRLKLLSAGAGITLFVVATGSGSSVVRAGVMACLALYARESGRAYDALRGFFAAIFFMLLWNPYCLAYDPGFQLSCAATIGLIVGAPLIEPRVGRFIKNAFWREGITTTIAAQAFVLPLLLYQTGNLSFVSLVANLLVLPAVPLAMATSFFAGLAGMLLPLIAPVFGIPAYLLLAYLIGVGKYAAAVPLAHATVPAFPFALVICMYAGLWFLARNMRAGGALMQPPLESAVRTPAS